ncbi:MAG: hypothetical protein ONB32_13285 [candidate division KSB1 bacterium]|nr:hypothetical protein [candidate division KSB1 bacterium]MDZ7399695.1 hypothetical protein [candidate division KSB1 bacterium]
MSQDRYNPAIDTRLKLLDQVKNALNTKHYSMKTEEAYAHWMKLIILLLDKIIRLRIIYRELHFGEFFRAACGKWNPNTKLWELLYKESVVLVLENIIAKEK